MTRRFVTLHDEAWIKENCICRENLLYKEREWVPKVYKDFTWTAPLLVDNGNEDGMYRSLVGKTIEVKQQSAERVPKMNGFGFGGIEDDSYNIPTWLIKAYWEIEE